MSHSEITRRAGVVGFFTLLSRITGLIRDIAIAYVFGTRESADAFFVAFRIPNLLRRLFAEGALTVSFVPVFTETLRGSKEEAKRLSDSTWTLLAIVLAGVTVAGIVFAPQIVQLTAWGFSDEPEKFRLTVFLTRVTFPFILLVSLAAWAMGVLNSLKHFSVPAAASIFLNLGIILGAVGLSRLTNPPVLGLALGVLGGGILQFGVHLPVLGRFGFFPKFSWNPGNAGVKKILGMMLPSAFGAAVYQFNVLIMTLLASFLPSGSVSYLWYADRLMEFPLGIFAVSMATVLLPSLSDHAAAKNIEGLKETFRFGLRVILFITLPAAGGLIVLSEPIIRIIYEHGTFSPDSTRMTAQALIFFALGLPFISGVRVTSNAFFSLQDAKTPVKAATGAVIVNLVLSLLLMGPMAHNGLALAVSLSSIFNLLFQMVAFRKKLGPLGLRKILAGVSRTSISTAVMMGILWWLSERGPLNVGGLPELTILIPAGVVVFVGVEWILRGREIQEIVAAVRSRKGAAKATTS